MRSLFTLAMLGAYALAAKQAPPSFGSTDAGDLNGSETDGSTATNVNEVEEVDVIENPYTPWTEEEIRDYVSENFGGRSWTVVEGTLLSDSARKDFAENIVTKLVNDWEDEARESFPPVCNSGYECRNDHFSTLITNLRNEWSMKLNTINTYLHSTQIEIKNLIEKHYEEAYECDPNCTCDNIMIEYNDITRIQGEITAEILELWTTISALYEKQTTILEHCPDYVEIDGEFYYDLTDRKMNDFERTEQGIFD